MWASLLNPYSAYDDLICCTGCGETAARLTASSLQVVPIGTGASPNQVLELIASPEPDCHLRPEQLERLLSGRADAARPYAGGFSDLLDHRPGPSVSRSAKPWHT